MIVLGGVTLVVSPECTSNRRQPAVNWIAHFLTSKIPWYCVRRSGSPTDRKLWSGTALTYTIFHRNSWTLWHNISSVDRAPCAGLSGRAV